MENHNTLHDNNENSSQANTFAGELEGEYKQCWESWRFFLAFRSTLLLFSFTVTSALLYLFFKDNAGKPLGDMPRFIICVLGTVFTYGIITIEGRNRQMYTVCLNRARAIELKGKEPPEFLYSNKYFMALWMATKEALCKPIKQPKNEEKKELQKDTNEHIYNLATVLIYKPIHLFSWMSGGIFLIYGTVITTWISLLVYISVIKHFRLTSVVVIVVAIILIILVLLKFWLRSKPK